MCILILINILIVGDLTRIQVDILLGETKLCAELSFGADVCRLFAEGVKLL